MRALVTLAGSLAAFSSQAQAAEAQFNLECNGTRTKLGTNEVRPFNMVYRIDLTANVFCFGACEKTERIEEVTPLNITMKNDIGRFGSSKIHLDRAKGTLTIDTALELLPGRREYHRVVASCAPMPFSGFPATKF